MEQMDKVKGAVAAVVGALTGLWGWYGWLVMVWGVCMLLDYLTGTGCALKEGVWSSKAAREGLWHKAGSVAAVLTACLLDVAIGQVCGNLPGLPVGYNVFLGPLVVVWYILTECGSVIENAGALGAPVPKWLAGRLEKLREKLEEAQETEGDDRE